MTSDIRRIPIIDNRGLIARYLAGKGAAALVERLPVDRDLIARFRHWALVALRPPPTAVLMEDVDSIVRYGRRLMAVSVPDGESRTEEEAQAIAERMLMMLGNCSGQCRRRYHVQL